MKLVANFLDPMIGSRRRIKEGGKMKIPKALAKELESPVTCTEEGEFVSLREFVSKKKPYFYPV